MPYELLKSEKPKGWFVITSSTKKKHSLKPFKTKNEAEKQLVAIRINLQMK